MWWIACCYTCFSIQAIPFPPLLQVRLSPRSLRLRARSGGRGGSPLPDVQPPERTAAYAGAAYANGAAPRRCRRGSPKQHKGSPRVADSRLPPLLDAAASGSFFGVEESSAGPSAMARLRKDVGRLRALGPSRDRLLTRLLVAKATAAASVGASGSGQLSGAAAAATGSVATPSTSLAASAASVGLQHLRSSAGSRGASRQGRSQPQVVPLRLPLPLLAAQRPPALSAAGPSGEELLHGLGDEARAAAEALWDATPSEVDASGDR